MQIFWMVFALFLIGAGLGVSAVIAAWATRRMSPSDATIFAPIFFLGCLFGLGSRSTFWDGFYDSCKQSKRGYSPNQNRGTGLWNRQSLTFAFPPSGRAVPA